MNPRILPIFVILLICALLTACSPSPAELDATAAQAAINDHATLTAKAPTATATFTPSPTPTHTPVPTLTPTPSPTRHPLAGEFVDGKLVLTDESFDQLVEIGSSFFDNGWYLFESFLYDAMLEYGLKSDQLQEVYDSQHEDYETLGNYDLAIENLLHILDLGYRQAEYLNGLCWDMALVNRPEEALPNCEEAVEADPSGSILDSRGLVYAMLGKYPEAANDFEAALKEDVFSDDEKTQRQEWVTALKAGNNPINDQVLALLRGEESSMDAEPSYTGDIMMSYLVEQYEGVGYTFSEKTIDGQPGLVGRFVDGNCQVEIVLLGDEKELLGGSSTILGCSHDQMDGHAWNFVGYFSRDVKELARVIVWQNADWSYVLEGKPITDISPTIGGFQFTVERTTVEGKDGIIVSVKPAE